MRKFLSTVTLMFLCSLGAKEAVAASVYLNQSNMTVEVGSGTSPGSFNNTFNGGQTINKVIDAPSADAAEFHNQTTHIWFTASQTGGGLELIFTFDEAIDINTLHFWNYTGEAYDVDNIDFTFFNSIGTEVGSLSVTPALGSSGGILAQDIPLAAPLNVKSVNAFLTGSNRQVDFQNIGFTGEVSAVPEPLTILGTGTAVAFGTGFKRKLSKAKKNKKNNG